MRAIEKNLAEVEVTPLSLRLIALFRAAQGLAAVQCRISNNKIIEQLAEGHRYKR